jgi:16S rRNA (guanine966-N2)-methyltransferase
MLRILAGEYKGRNLLPPPGKSETRPITGSVKKSLFGMLGEDLSGQTVVDLYCGTGTLGIESLSRGATKCYFAERDGAVVECLRRNLQTVGAMDRSVIWRGDIEDRLPGWIGGVQGPVDLAFVDPPYLQARQWDWQRTGERIFGPLAARLADDGVVVLRTDDTAQVPAELGPLAVGRTRQYGNMVVRLLTLSGGQDPAANQNDQ